MCDMKCAVKYAYACNIVIRRQSHETARKRTLVACVWDSEMAHYTTYYYINNIVIVIIYIYIRIY